MARKRKCTVFVSYSRHDEALVRPLASLLGTVAEDTVFIDVDSLRPGDDWKREIGRAIRQSRVFVLCWCCRALRSDIIPEEVALAFEDPTRRIVPVLLCDAERPGPILHLQWVDLRSGVRHDCAHPPERSPKWDIVTAAILNDSLWSAPRHAIQTPAIVTVVVAATFFFGVPLEYASYALIGYLVWYSASGYYRSRKHEQADAIAGRVRAYFARQSSVESDRAIHSESGGPSTSIP